MLIDSCVFRYKNGLLMFSAFVAVHKEPHQPLAIHNVTLLSVVFQVLFCKK